MRDVLGEEPGNGQEEAEGVLGRVPEQPGIPDSDAARNLGGLPLREAVSPETRPTDSAGSHKSTTYNGWEFNRPGPFQRRFGKMSLTDGVPIIREAPPEESERSPLFEQLGDDECLWTSNKPFPPGPVDRGTPPSSRLET